MTDSERTRPGATGTIDEAYGPAGSTAPESPVYGPQAATIHPVTLVLGPGLARGFAHIGVLRVLAENKIPIAAIYGMEMGSLLGALYARDANINHLEWSLLGFNDDLFRPSAGFIGRLLGKPNSSPLVDKIKAEFGNIDLSSMKIPLKIAIERPRESISPAAVPAMVIEKGSVAKVLRVSMAAPELLEPGTWDGAPAEAATAPSAEQQLCEDARERYGSPVVLIETSGSGIDPSSADLVIRPNLEGIGPKDYAKRTDAEFRGKTATLDRMAELHRAVNPESKSP